MAYKNPIFIVFHKEHHNIQGGLQKGVGSHGCRLDSAVCSRILRLLRLDKDKAIKMLFKKSMIFV
jgi:hypothetical protein